VVDKERIYTMTEPRAIASEPRTVGLSPKTVAATIATYVATLLVGFLATKVGVDIEVDTAAAFLLPLVTAVVTFVSSYLSKPGPVIDVPVEPLEPPINPNV
jgi:hypothetical protein